MTKGYYYDKYWNRYHVRVYRDGKYHHVGRYKTPEEASIARQRFIENYKPSNYATNVSAQDSLSRILNSNHYMIVRTR